MLDLENTTPVVFREWRNGDTIALFPAEPEGRHFSCQSYMHVGQHGAADYRHVVSLTRPASPEAIKTLSAELSDIGYKNLVPISRVTRRIHEYRLRVSHVLGGTL